MIPSKSVPAFCIGNLKNFSLVYLVLSDRELMACGL
jgi:hypothetical protein